MKENIESIYPVTEYIKQASCFISKSNGISLQEANKFVMEQIKKNIKIPIVQYYCKEENGDVIKKEDSLIDYIKDTIKEGDIIVPSFTSYYHPSKQKSVHAEFMLHNTKERSKYKKEAFKNKQDGDMESFNYNNNMQKAKKILNNSLSGAYASKSTILRNPSAHYTLTSITRCVSSIGNAISESLICGNKHFKNSDIVFNYITAIVTNLNRKNIELCMDKYKLHIPTVEELLQMIKYSSQWYWEDENILNRIKEYLDKLDNVERVAIMYTNDLWNLRTYNEELIRNIINKFINKRNDITDDGNVLKDIPEHFEILGKIICNEEVKGLNINYKEFKGKDIGFLLVSTIVNVYNVYKEHELLFNTFLLTNILPPSISYIKEMFRECIVLSDTDSTCGSYEKWTNWYDFPDKSIAVAAVIVTLLSISVDNGLSLLSTNMNIPNDRLDVLKMKNEFFWPIFISGNTNKHYFSNITIQEGNVFKEPDLEIKGVHFIASSVNQDITKQIHQMMLDINTKLSQGEKISLIEYINKIRDLEIMIVDKVHQGDTSFFKLNNIKESKAYQNSVEQSPYFHYLLWREVFEDRYGEIGEPPYMSMKIPTTLDNKKKLDAYLLTIQDEVLRSKLTNFLSKYNKTSLATVMLPSTIVNSNGVPYELRSIINTHRIILDNLKSAYLMLESLGFYLKNDQTIIGIYGR